MIEMMMINIDGYESFILIQELSRIARASYNHDLKKPKKQLITFMEKRFVNDDKTKICKGNKTDKEIAIFEHTKTRENKK